MSESSDMAERADSPRRPAGDAQAETPSQQARAVCCICASPALYTCPACGRRTCSLTCVRVHKSDFACPGRRDVAAKVSLGDFDDAQLQRDFHFLEDCRRVIDNVERGWRQGVATTPSATRTVPRASSRGRALSPAMAALREAAKRRGVLCQIMSSGMWKHESNTSHYDRATDTITWRCVFNFRRRLPPLCAPHRPAEQGGARDTPATAAVAASCDVQSGNKDKDDSCVDDGDFTVTTDAACERCRLDHLLRYCWASDLTALPRLPIHLRYNRTAEYVQTVKDKPSGNDNGNADNGSGDGNAEAGSGKKALCETVAEKALQEHAAPHTPPTSAATSEDTSDTPDDDELVDPSRPPVVGEDGAEEGARQPEPWEAQVRATSEPEARNAARVRAFLAGADDSVAVLVKAERLADSRPRYFSLVPEDTLNENLRRVFFISEFPVFEVVPVGHLAHYALVTEADKAALRLSLRPKQCVAPAQDDPSAVHGEAGSATAARRGDGDAYLSEARRARVARVPCRMYLAQRCTAGGACPYRHCSAAEVPLCYNFAKRGHCARGSRCGFRHDGATATRQTHKRARPGAPPLPPDSRTSDTQDTGPAST